MKVANGYHVPISKSIDINHRNTRASFTIEYMGWFTLIAMKISLRNQRKVRVLINTVCSFLHVWLFIHAHAMPHGSLHHCQFIPRNITCASMCNLSGFRYSLKLSNLHTCTRVHARPYTHERYTNYSLKTVHRQKDNKHQ